MKDVIYLECSKIDEIEKYSVIWDKLYILDDDWYFVIPRDIHWPAAGRKGKGEAYESVVRACKTFWKDKRSSC